MSKTNKETTSNTAVKTEVQDPVISEVDGEPIYHAPEEEGEYHE